MDPSRPRPWSTSRPSGTVWTLTLTRQEDDLLVPFTPVPDASVPAGRYTAGFVELELKPSTGPRAVVGGSLRAGEYYDGRLYSLLLSPEWRASATSGSPPTCSSTAWSFRRGTSGSGRRLARLRVLASAIAAALAQRRAPGQRQPPTSRPPTCACATR